MLVTERVLITCWQNRNHGEFVGKIIAICNQKGGVGKTTTAVNIAACLAVLERRCLLVDMDPQSNATTGLGFDKNDMEPSVYDVITHRKRGNKQLEFEGIVRPSGKVEFLDVAPSNPDLAGAEVELVNMIAREKQRQDYIEKFITK